MTCTNGNSKNNKLKASRTNAFITGTLAVATSLALAAASHSAFASTAHTFTEYVPVLKVEPIFRNVTVREPLRICRPAAQNNHYRPGHNRHTHRYKPERSDHPHQRSTNSEVFTTGVIGGAVGRELTKEVNARPGHSATRNNTHQRANAHSRHRHHCTTTIQTRTERQRDGFNVTYRYHGHRYQTHTRHHPGDRLAITVTIDPQKY